MARGKHLIRYLRHLKCLMDAPAPSIEHMWYYLVASPDRGPCKHLAVARRIVHPRSRGSPDCLPATQACVAKSVSRRG